MLHQNCYNENKCTENTWQGWKSREIYWGEAAERKGRVTQDTHALVVWENVLFCERI